MPKKKMKRQFCESFFFLGMVLVKKYCLKKAFDQSKTSQ